MMSSHADVKVLLNEQDIALTPLFLLPFSCTCGRAKYAKQAFKTRRLDIIST